MKYIIFFFSFLTMSFFVNAQSSYNWKGGTPGKESSWNEPRNWDKNRVPANDDKVIIKSHNNGHFAQPEIISEVIVGWVEVHQGATLTIKNEGSLTLEGTYIYSEGISLFGGKVEAEGSIRFQDIEEEFIEAFSPDYLPKEMALLSNEN